MSSDYVAVFDVDGTFTDGTFTQTKSGKYSKVFGADDWDALDELRKHIPIQLITADKKGYDIVKSRVETDKGLPLDLVSNKPEERTYWIYQEFPNKKIIYVGDGIYDWYVLDNVEFGITTIDALPHVRSRADYVSPRRGANRFVADACMFILSMFGFMEDPYNTIGLKDPNSNDC